MSIVTHITDTVCAHNNNVDMFPSQNFTPQISHHAITPFWPERSFVNSLQSCIPHDNSLITFSGSNDVSRISRFIKPPEPKYNFLQRSPGANAAISIRFPGPINDALREQMLCSAPAIPFGLRDQLRSPGANAVQCTSLLVHALKQHPCATHFAPISSFQALSNHHSSFPFYFFHSLVTGHHHG